MISRSSVTLLDACALINFVASRQFEAILKSVKGSVGVVDLVAAESRYVFRGGDGEDAREQDPIDLQPLIESSLLSIIGEETEDELLTFIDLTRLLDDGEAMTIALALHRGYTVITDDRKAERVMAERGVVFSSSLEIIKSCYDQMGFAPDLQRELLLAVRQRGRLMPRSNHPYRPWWERVLG